jgi:SPX domain protein involved in polyphosphate accumulation
MPKEIESLFVESLELEAEKFLDIKAKRQSEMRDKLKELDETEKKSELKEAS